MKVQKVEAQAVLYSHSNHCQDPKLHVRTIYSPVERVRATEKGKENTRFLNYINV